MRLNAIHLGALDGSPSKLFGLELPAYTSVGSARKKNEDILTYRGRGRKELSKVQIFSLRLLFKLSKQTWMVTGRITPQLASNGKLTSLCIPTFQLQDLASSRIPSALALPWSLSPYPKKSPHRQRAEGAGFPRFHLLCTNCNSTDWPYVATLICLVASHPILYDVVLTAGLAVSFGYSLAPCQNCG